MIEDLSDLFGHQKSASPPPDRLNRLDPERPRRSALDRISTTLLAAIGLTLAVEPLSAADRLQTGQWEFTSTTTGEAHTFKRCVTPEEARSVNGDTRSARAYAEKQTAGHCKITDYKVDGDAVSYAMAADRGPSGAPPPTTATHSKAT